MDPTRRFDFAKQLSRRFRSLAAGALLGDLCGTLLLFKRLP